MTDYRETVEQIHGLSSEMLVQAQSSAWEDVARLEQKRDVLLGQLTSFSLAVFDEAVAQTLRQIIDINTALETLGQLEKETCWQQYSEAQQNKNAISVYSASPS